MFTNGQKGLLNFYFLMFITQKTHKVRYLHHLTDRSVLFYFTWASLCVSEGGGWGATQIVFIVFFRENASFVFNWVIEAFYKFRYRVSSWYSGQHTHHNINTHHQIHQIHHITAHTNTSNNRMNSALGFGLVFKSQPFPGGVQAQIKTYWYSYLHHNAMHETEALVVIRKKLWYIL